MKGKHEFEILHELDTEFAALCLEIQEIRKVGKNNTLNLSDGGEGSTMTIKTREVNGQLQFKVVLKKSKTRKPRPKRRRSRHKRQRRR